VPSALEAGVKYCWNMQAHNSAGWSSVSNTLFFQTQSQAQLPSTPTVTSPGSSSGPGTIIDTLTPTLQWNPVSGADYYALAISKYPYGSSNIVYNPQQLYGTSNAVPSALEAGMKYCWNMQAHNSAGWSSVSNTLFFQTQSQAQLLSVSARIDSYNAEPRDVIIGNATTLSFTFTNTGTEPWTFYAAASLKKPDGTKVNLTPKPVALDPGQLGSATWTYTVDQEGGWDLVYSIWKEQEQVNSLGNTGWLLRDYIIGRASDSNGNYEPALNFTEAATLEVANLSYDEIAALGTAIDKVLSEEWKLGSIRKPVLIRAQMLAGAVESVGGMFSGFTGFFRKLLASSGFIDIKPPEKIITLSEETEIAVMFIEEVGTQSLMALFGPVGKVGAAIVKILSPVAQWGAKEWAAWRSLNVSLLRVTKQGVGTMDVIYSKELGEASVIITLDDFEEETRARDGWGKECLYILIPFDTKPPNLRKTNDGFDYKIIYKEEGVNENSGVPVAEVNWQPSLAPAPGNATGQRIDNVLLTYYTLPLEKNLQGTKTGNSETVTNPPNIEGTFYKEFLYSGYGVAMQGTGISLDGKYIKYVRGGSGWNNNHTWLNNPASTVFTLSNGVIGSSGHLLTEWQSVAVDPTVIPLGYYVWIESEQAWFHAEDTGGAIKGKHIDIYVGISERRPKSQYSNIYIQPQPPN
jgi:3D (Asp-Asp-Asp) domain-containing protein